MSKYAAPLADMRFVLEELHVGAQFRHQPRLAQFVGAVLHQVQHHGRVNLHQPHRLIFGEVGQQKPVEEIPTHRRQRQK